MVTATVVIEGQSARCEQ